MLYNDQKNDHDDAFMPTQGNDENTESDIIQNGNKPEFAKEDDMSKLIKKPSGNMVRMKCTSKTSPEPNITW